MELRCCQVDCDKPAEFQLVSVRSTKGIVQGAGPDPYSDETHACTDHVGALLGYQPDAANPREIFWQVFGIEAEQAATA